MVIEFSYSIEWVETQIPYSERNEVFQYNYYGVWEPGALRWIVSCGHWIGMSVVWLGS
jgi:hypothetical protein